MHLFKLIQAIGLLAFLTPQAQASVEQDALYRFQKFVPFVLQKKTNPVYGVVVEEALIEYLKKQPDIEFDKATYEKALLLDEIREFPRIREPINPRLGPVVTLLSLASNAGADTVLFAEIQKTVSKVSLLVVLVNAKNAEIIESEKLDVPNRFSVESFQETVRKAVKTVMDTIPFDATVLRRIDDRIVLNKGEPHIKEGMELITYTIEDIDDISHLVETGKMVITEVGDKISFGKVTWENLPLTLEVGNKARIPTKPRYHAKYLKNAIPMLSRSPASSPSSYALNADPKAEIGKVDLHFGASLHSTSQKTAAGQGVDDKTLLPGGDLNGELWLTQRAFVQFGFEFGFGATAGEENQSASTSDLYGAVGYRFPLKRGNTDLPTANVKIGFANQSFDVDPSTSTEAFLSTSYTGLLVGGGALVPLTEKQGVGFEISALLFASASETPTKSGDATGARGWNFDLHYYYQLLPNLELDAKLKFQNNSADFTGTGTRPTPVVASSQTNRALMVGLNYYF